MAKVTDPSLSLCDWRLLERCWHLALCLLFYPVPDSYNPTARNLSMQSSWHCNSLYHSGSIAWLTLNTPGWLSHGWFVYTGDSSAHGSKKAPNNAEVVTFPVMKDMTDCLEKWRTLIIGFKLSIFLGGTGVGNVLAAFAYSGGSS